MPRIMTVGLFAVGLSLTALWGCGGNDRWYGEWQGDLKFVGADAPPGPIKDTLNRVRLTLRPDGTFDLVRSGIPESGVCRFGGDEAFLTVRTRLGEPVSQGGSGTQAANKDLVLEWQKDGSVLLRDPGGFDPAPVRLSRRAQR